MKKNKKISAFSMWWFNNHIRFLLWKLEFTASIMRALFCRRGLHRLLPGSTKVTNSHGLYLHTQFIRCIYCETHFFTNKANKDHYRRIRARERGDFEPFINALNLKDNKYMSKRARSRLMSGRMKIKEFDSYPHKRKK